MNTDGSLPAALDALHTATARLVDERKQHVDGTLYAAPSLYDELVREIPAGSAGTGCAFMGGFYRSTAPAWLDALDLRHQIDTRITQWHRTAIRTRREVSRQRDVSAPELLRHYVSRSFRPQDSRMLTEQAAELESFALSITALLEPAHVKTISEPCPACGKRWVHKWHAGEQVRAPALQLIAEQGCTCQACRAHWPPQHYMLLCRVLGLALPEGVVA